ncbi:bacterio-opsin activator domain-containing protein [Halostagnicola sp. A-GB9-2]|uniref:bacterio-opsin activator domain-containing protein n=1 Tax=Halostagnicola sp. A-GB9-2 TaxID=3048066 RepID=UPI0024C0C348|nr:bacterio-opsin activator domain-containing protein [Halostagnicola sp. A-GB9-2]MDJ1431383.1 bacterio-opsin activator domain-containing protein [Halostagnicola sp. A-GB9-2]
MPPPIPDPELHFETIAQRARDGIITITVDSTIRYANPAIKDIFGYPPEELLGRSITELMSSEQAQRYRDSFDRYLRTNEATLDWDDIRFSGQHQDGEKIPLSISLSEFEHDGTQYFSGIVRDVTDHQRREAQLAGLNSFAQELTEAESRDGVCERTVSAAQSTLEQPIASILLYDEEGGRLEPCSWTPAVDALSIADDGSLFATDRSIPWDVFVRQESRVFTDLLAETTADADETNLRSAILHPIGTHGVFVVGATESGTFVDSDIDIASILVANAYSAIERVDRERALRDRKNQLEEKTETLERVRRINDIIRDLTKALRQATERDEITSDICSQLVSLEPYRFAWFGSLDPASDKLVSEAAAGVEDGYLEAIVELVDGQPVDQDRGSVGPVDGERLDDKTANGESADVEPVNAASEDDESITAESANGETETDDSTQSPIERAIRTRTPRVQNTIYKDPPFEPWRQEAIQRGYRSNLAIPVVYRDTFYGVLDLYATTENAFNQLEIAVLRELGETIGYALNADERKQAFTSEQSVELAFDVRGRADPILDLVEQTDGQIELENLIERRDGATTMFFAAHEQDPGEVKAWAKDSELVHNVRLLTDRSEECLFECVLDDSTVWAQLLHRGAVVREVATTDESARIVIGIPRSADPRAFDTLLSDRLDEAELVARREYEEPVMTPEEFEAEFRDRLTERQNEVLETAYYAGFFEWPRETQSNELADILDIAQPTTSRHIRSSEQKFLSMLYEDSRE